MRKQFAIVLLLVATLIGCHPHRPQQQLSPQSPNLKESLEKANRYLANEEESDIQNYIERHKFDMVATGTGLRYQVLKEGVGAVAQSGQQVSMEYELYDIMGDLLYSSEKEGVMTFVVGKSDVVSGLDEAVRHLRKGDVARLIIPSHLGYGLPGDQNLISGRATLIYIVKILEIK